MSNTSNRPSKTRTCCCAAGHRRASRPRRWRRERDARGRPSGGGRRPDHVRRARRRFFIGLGIDGIVSVMRLRAADNAYLVVILAESMDAFDAAAQAIMSTELLPGEE